MKKFSPEQEKAIEEKIELFSPVLYKGRLDERVSLEEFRERLKKIEERII